MGIAYTRGRQPHVWERVLRKSNITQGFVNCANPDRVYEWTAESRSLSERILLIAVVVAGCLLKDLATRKTTCRGKKTARLNNIRTQVYTARGFSLSRNDDDDIPVCTTP